MSANRLNDTACPGSGRELGDGFRCAACTRDVVLTRGGVAARHRARCALNAQEGDRCELAGGHGGRCKGLRFHQRKAARLGGCTR